VNCVHEFGMAIESVCIQQGNRINTYCREKSTSRVVRLCIALCQLNDALCWTLCTLLLTPHLAFHRPLSSLSNICLGLQHFGLLAYFAPIEGHCRIFVVESLLIPYFQICSALALQTEITFK